jgi:hypothetical protein
MQKLFYLSCCLGGMLLLNGCAESCTGNIETTVLYAKPGAKGGRDIYVDVVNKPDLGIQQTLLYEGKEFGTFPHVVIIQDPASKFASNSKICFTGYQKAPRAASVDLAEQEIPRLQIY